MWNLSNVCGSNLVESMNRNLVFVCLILVSILSAKAQGEGDMSEASLNELGFENVRMVADGNSIYVALEDPSHRGTFRGAVAALKELYRQSPELRHVYMNIEEYGVARVCVNALRSDDGWNVTVGYDVEPVKNALRDVKSSKSAYGKIDVSLIPIVSLNNHLYDRLFEVGLFFSPSFSTSLWKGNRIIVQPLIPVYTNYDKYNSHKNVRLGVATISQDVFEDEHWTGKVALGSFYQDVVGGYGEVGYRLNSKLDLGVHFGYSYTSLFYDSKWYLGKPVLCNAMLKGSYYEPRYSFQIQFQCGRFMFGDWGGRLDVTRHYGEYAIGVYGILTGGEHNGGFHFAIPFGGKRQKRNGFFRVRLPEYYDMQYSMVSYWRYTWERMGREFEEIPDKNRSAHYWQAEYIEKYINKMLNNTYE